MKYDAVLFDLDGTLLDTRADIGDAMNRVLVSRGFPTHSVEDYGRFLGSGARVLVMRALPEDHRDEDTVANCLKIFQHDYAQNCAVKTIAYPGIVELLDELTAREIKLGILTNKPHPITLVCVREILPKWSFSVVLGHQEGRPIKPDPAGALQAVRELGTSPEKILYLGDTEVDMETSHKARMVPVGVSWGFRPQDVLMRSGAQMIIHHPLDLLSYL